MDKDNEISLPSDWVQRKLTLLQRELKTSGKWPEPANQLWPDLNQLNQAEEIKADDTMFSIVVSDALDGVDISKRHPVYYRRMLQTPELFQAFIDVVEILEADKAGILEPIPETKSAVPDVALEDPAPVFQGLSDGRWAVLWRQTMAELNFIFNSLGQNLALDHRSARGLLEESVAPLISSEAVVGEKNLGVRLSAVLADDPDELKLRLTVVLLDDEADDFSVDALQAGIEWGAYRETQPVNEFGQAIFPPLPIQFITDETGETINSDLQLTIFPESE